MLAEDIARLMAMIPVEEATANKDSAVVRGKLSVIIYCTYTCLQKINVTVHQKKAVGCRRNFSSERGEGTFCFAFEELEKKER